MRTKLAIAYLNALTSKETMVSEAKNSLENGNFNTVSSIINSATPPMVLIIIPGILLVLSKFTYFSSKIKALKKPKAIPRVEK